MPAQSTCSWHGGKIPYAHLGVIYLLDYTSVAYNCLVFIKIALNRLPHNFVELRARSWREKWAVTHQPLCTHINQSDGFSRISGDWHFKLKPRAWCECTDCRGSMPCPISSPRTTRGAVDLVAVHLIQLKMARLNCTRRTPAQRIVVVHQCERYSNSVIVHHDLHIKEF